ncbi:hypothetical protein [Planctopirus hydrillae]|uniref:Uncharacterized protein n=1 Tax=Planctopirus hydrillae TaxID=1841610 RepID=A0A1C3E923_9PLAN|nr:hypothetical protein [Planctopirus hydrillae]ODA29733.1 hypothetical protein A6X21_07535 [Planctopirus hydrillae]
MADAPLRGRGPSTAYWAKSLAAQFGGICGKQFLTLARVSAMSTRPHACVLDFKQKSLRKRNEDHFSNWSSTKIYPSVNVLANEILFSFSKVP